MINLSDGIVEICELVDKADKGNMSKPVLVSKLKEYYGERTVGFTRFYEAKTANEQIDMLIRIWGNKLIRIGMYAVLPDGDQFRITQIQHLLDDGLQFTDLTLSRLEKNYDLERED